MARRLNSGIYAVQRGARLFEIEAFGRDDWLLFEMIDGTREYIRDFWYKRDAIAFLEEQVSCMTL